MPFSPKRLARFREIKGFRTQGALSKKTRIAQSHLSDFESGKAEPTLAMLEMLADALECTTDFLLGRVLGKESLESAASRMSFEVFTERPDVSNESRDRCRRVLSHKAPPLTEQAWRDLSEQIDLAIGPSGGPLRIAARSN